MFWNLLKAVNVRIRRISKNIFALTNYRFWYVYLTLLFVFGATAASGPGHGLLIHEVSRSHTTTHHSR